MKISACLITKNESANIARCLESIPKTVDEIIVADTGSTDDTVSIAESYGARVFHYEWDNNFSSAKNYALGKASGDWIIFLDADEYLNINTQNILHDTLKKIHSNKSFDAIYSIMINTDGYNGKIISKNITVRIFRNNGIRYTGAIHEQLHKNGHPFKCVRVKNKDLVIYHTGYALGNLANKFSRNLALLEDQERSGHINELTYYYLSSSYSNLGNQELAVKYALLALKELKLKETPVAFKPYVFLITGMLSLIDQYTFEEIEKYVREALDLYPNHPELWRLDARLKKAENKYHQAIKSYLQALDCHQNFNQTMDNIFYIYLEEVYCDLGYLSNLTGVTLDAVEYYYQALKTNKYSVKAFTSLYDMIKGQKVGEIVFFLNTIYNKEDEKDLTFLCKVLINLNEQAAGYYYNLWDIKFNK